MNRGGRNHKTLKKYDTKMVPRDWDHVWGYVRFINNMIVNMSNARCDDISCYSGRPNACMYVSHSRHKYRFSINNLICRYVCI